MKKLFLLLILSLAALTLVGLQRGWFQLSTVRSEEAAGDKTHITLTVDKDKIHDDEAKALDKVQHATDRAKEKVNEHHN